MNWELAKSKGEKFLEDLKTLMGGLDSPPEIVTKGFLKTHALHIETGGWKGFTSMNEVSYEEMEVILGLNKKEIKIPKGVVSINWELAKKQGQQFIYDLNTFLDGDYSLISRKTLMRVHQERIGSGYKWQSFKSFNGVSLEEMELILDLKREKKFDKPITAHKKEEEMMEKYILENGGKKNVKLEKDHDTKGLEYEDYTELIAIAESLGDIEWRNELLERECGLK